MYDAILFVHKEGESYISIPYLAVLVQVTDEHLEAHLHLVRGQVNQALNYLYFYRLMNETALLFKLQPI